MSPLSPALPGPLLFFLVALAVAVLAYLVHRLAALSGSIAAGGCLALAWMSLHQLSGKPLLFLGRALELGRSFEVLGREWAFTPSGLAVLTFVFVVAGLAFLLALPAPQGWLFYPSGAGVVAVLILAITAQQYIFQILFLWLAANLAVFVLAGGRPRATTGALRFLVFTSIAVMPLLVLPRYFEPDITEFSISPDGALQVASLLMVIGFGVLLMMVPFHGQMVAIAVHSAPMVPTFVLSVFPPVVLYILFTLVRAHPQLVQDRFMFDVCRWLGVGSVAIGGLAAMGQRRWGYLVGYATLVDWGAGMIALGQGTVQGIRQVTVMVIWRALSMLLVGIGSSIVFKVAGKTDDTACCGGLLRRRPVSVLALILGLLSLAAFPLTPGAMGRWPLILDLMASDPKVAVTLILAGIGVTVGTLSGVRACVSPAPEGVKESKFGVFVDTGFALLALCLVGYAFLNPAPWLDTVQRLLTEETFPVS